MSNDTQVKEQVQCSTGCCHHAGNSANVLLQRCAPRPIRSGSQLTLSSEFRRDDSIAAEQIIAERRLSVIDVCEDADVSNLARALLQQRQSVRVGEHGAGAAAAAERARWSELGGRLRAGNEANAHVSHAAGRTMRKRTWVAPFHPCGRDDAEVCAKEQRQQIGTKPQ